MNDLALPTSTLPRPRPGLTCLLGVALALTALSQALAYSSGAIGFARHLLWTVPCLYFLCICVHDAVHGVSLKNKRANNLVGFVLALVITLPFPLLQSAHLKHHRAIAKQRQGANVDVTDDPEAVVYQSSVWSLVLRLPFIPFWYLRSLRSMRPLAIALTFFHLGLVAAAAVALHVAGVDVLSAWAAPVLLAIVWFGFTTVYVPHGPHAPLLMRFLNAHSGWHDDHHRDPRFPFHQYATVRAAHLQSDHQGHGRAYDPVVFLWAKRLW